MKYALITIAILLSGCSQGAGFDCPNKRGDMDYDGVLAAADAAIILDLSLGHTSVNDCQLVAADYNRDGVIDSVDARLVFEAALNE